MNVLSKIKTRMYLDWKGSICCGKSYLFIEQRYKKRDVGNKLCLPRVDTHKAVSDGKWRKRSSMRKNNIKIAKYIKSWRGQSIVTKISEVLINSTQVAVDALLYVWLNLQDLDGINFTGLQEQSFYICSALLILWILFKQKLQNTK